MGYTNLDSEVVFPFCRYMLVLFEVIEHSTAAILNMQ